MVINGVWIGLLCTEREPDGIWEDCTWSTTVMFGNAAHAEQRYPITQAEYEALRRVSGDSMSGGSNYGDAKLGMERRWGWSVPVLYPWDDAGRYTSSTIDQQPIGTAIAVGGMYAVLPDRLRVTGYLGGHASLATRISAEEFWWQDPLRPAGYAGQRITRSELHRFVSALPGARLMAIRVGARAATPEVDDDMYAFKAERWLLDGGPARITTVGTPLKADGTPDWSRRLALVSGKAGANPQLVELPRRRLSPVSDDLTEEFFAALAGYTVPAATTAAAFNAGVEAAATEALTAKR